MESRADIRTAVGDFTTAHTSTGVRHYLVYCTIYEKNIESYCAPLTIELGVNCHKFEQRIGLPNVFYMHIQVR